ncbi:MAG: hypothetical protein DMG13_26990 [Acidobacteria bacterium]|nr:MAG: hypothetical protein DMG13_26990 [Acidobacteriota bacterium]
MNLAFAETEETLSDMKPSGLEPTARVHYDLNRVFVHNSGSEGSFRPAPGPAENILPLQELPLSDNRVAEPVIFLIPEQPKVSFHFQVLQQWEGTVVEVQDESIVVRLRDLATSETAEKRATISKDEVSDSDQDLVKLGAVFYWIIGYRIELHGQKSMVSTIKFRRLPSWTRRELKRVEERASEFDIFFET